jgi:hypothetical protein
MEVALRSLRDCDGAEHVAAGCAMPSPLQIRGALERLLGSRVFHAAPTQRTFLRYTVEHTLGGRCNLKEYCIAVDGLGRHESFDPRRDSIVRIAALKMRLNLTRYYQRNGQTDPVRIEFPKGSYVPVFRLVQ